MRSVNSCLWVGGDCGGQEQKKTKNLLTATDRSMSHISPVTHTHRLEVDTKSEDTLMPLGLCLCLLHHKKIGENYGEIMDMPWCLNQKMSFSTFFFTPGLSHGSWIPSKDWLWLNSTYSFVEISCRLMSRDEQKAEKTEWLCLRWKTTTQSSMTDRTARLPVHCFSLYSFMFLFDSCGSAHWHCIKFDDYIPPKLSLHVVSMVTP